MSRLYRCNKIVKFFLEWEMFQIGIVEKIKICIWFSENCAVYEIMSKNIVEPEEPQMTSQYGACALHSG
jgi:hypothetical protein